MIGPKETIKLQALDRKYYDTKVAKIQVRIKLRNNSFYFATRGMMIIEYDLTSKKVFGLGDVNKLMNFSLDWISCLLGQVNLFQVHRLNG